MNKEETVKFLALVARTFPNFSVDELTERSWMLLLQKAQSRDVWDAFVSIVEKGARQFAPNASEILAEIRDLKNPNEILDAELAWELKATKDADDLTKDAFKLWGGHKRLGILPDITYAGLSEEQRIEIATERKRFISIYKGLAKRTHAEKQREEISSRDAAKLLNKISQRLENK